MRPHLHAAVAATLLSPVRAASAARFNATSLPCKMQNDI
jgi:hypothetical protein